MGQVKYFTWDYEKYDGQEYAHWRRILINRKMKYDCHGWCMENFKGQFMFAHPKCSSPSPDGWCGCHSPLLFIESRYDYFRLTLRLKFFSILVPIIHSYAKPRNGTKQRDGC